MTHYHINDVLEAYWGCDFPLKIHKFQVYNRWGNLIYTQIQPAVAKWDGFVRGTNPKPDVYVWYLEFEFLREGKVEQVRLSGDVTLIPT